MKTYTAYIKKASYKSLWWILQTEKFTPSAKGEAVLLHCIAQASSLQPWHNAIQNGDRAFGDTLQKSAVITTI